MPNLSNVLGLNNSGVNGTGKRIYYAMLSYNTANNQGGFAFYDDEFRPVFSYGEGTSYNAYDASNVVYMAGGSSINYAAILGGSGQFSGTQNTPSSSSAYFLSSTGSSSEFGNVAVDIFSDGTFAPGTRKSGMWNNKYIMSLRLIDSNHSNKNIAYVLAGGVIRAIDVTTGSIGFMPIGTSAYTVTSLDTNMSGSASYNLARKEMVILSFSSSGGAFNVITFSNLDLDTYPDPAVAFARPEVVRTNSTVSLATNWAVNNNESYYGLKPFLCDNGLIYVTVMFSSSSFRLYSFTRSGTSAVTAANVTSQGLTTSHGVDQGWPYGQRKITSRDGSTVVAFCPYYYYNSGIASYMINRTTATYTVYANTSTSFGIQPLPYKDNGWAFFFASNGYASNYGGVYIDPLYLKSSASGGFTQVGTTILLPHFPYPNTTNYPGMTQVSDYNLLTSSNGGAK